MSPDYSVQSQAAIARVLRERRTVHDFLPDEVAPEIIRDALDIARWAPNHHRTEPWRWYLLGEKAQRAIAELNAGLVAASRGERAAEIKRRRWLAMPGWLVMTAARSDDAVRLREDYAACCCAAQNFMLYLWSQGIGVKWTTGAVTRENKFAEIVGFAPGEEDVVGLFWYGKPGGATEQHRRDLSQCLVEVE